MAAEATLTRTTLVVSKWKIETEIERGQLRASNFGNCDRDRRTDSEQKRDTRAIYDFVQIWPKCLPWVA